MKKLLVISENVDLSKYLRDSCERIDTHNDWQLDFCYTSYNSQPAAMIEFGATEINVKLVKSVEWIVKNYDMVFSLHCKQIFPPELVSRIPCFNFHPGLNPFNRGWYPQVFSILNGLPIGATIHLMDSEVDHGSIIAQEEVEIKASDTSLDLYQRVIAVEKKLIDANLESILKGTYELSQPVHEGNYNSVGDFEKLCRLDLDKSDTLRNHIRLLRALSHGAYSNGFFIEDGNRYYVKIEITNE